MDPVGDMTASWQVSRVTCVFFWEKVRSTAHCMPFSLFFMFLSVRSIQFQFYLVRQDSHIGIVRVSWINLFASSRVWVSKRGLFPDHSASLRHVKTYYSTVPSSLPS